MAEQPPFAWEIKSFRSSFLISYGRRIGERLAAISDEAQAEVADGSLLPVLASRREAVDTARDEAFPDLRALRVSLSNADGLLAGQAAADQADLHRGRVRGATGLLDRT